MRIEENDFIIEQSSDTSNLFDLQLLVTVKEKIKGKVTGNENDKFKKAGYGLPLSSCIKKIIYNRLNREKEVYTLNEFLLAIKELNKNLKYLTNE